MLHAAEDGAQTIRYLSDDTDVFVLLAAAATMQHWLYCIDYCKCDGGLGCFSRFTIKHMNIEDDEGSLNASDDDDKG